MYYRNIVGDYVLDAKGNNRYDFGQDFILDENGEKIQIGVDGDGNPVYRQYSRKYGSNVNPVATTDLDIRENLYETVSLRPYVEIVSLMISNSLPTSALTVGITLELRIKTHFMVMQPLHREEVISTRQPIWFQRLTMLTWNKSLTFIILRC